MYGILVHGVKKVWTGCLGGYKGIVGGSLPKWQPGPFQKKTLRTKIVTPPLWYPS